MGPINFCSQVSLSFFIGGRVVSDACTLDRTCFGTLYMHSKTLPRKPSTLKVKSHLNNSHISASLQKSRELALRVGNQSSSRYVS